MTSLRVLNFICAIYISTDTLVPANRASTQKYGLTYSLTLYYCLQYRLEASALHSFHILFSR